MSQAQRGESRPQQQRPAVSRAKRKSVRKQTALMRVIVAPGLEGGVRVFTANNLRGADALVSQAEA
ncbi:MAG: hypothetical protein N2C14_02725, partial [Planctomycetales bacterium]